MATPTNLPSAFTDNTTLSAATLNNLRGAFRILQVVQATYSAVIVSNSTTTMADTNLTATITPQDTNSKILVMVTQTHSKSPLNIANCVGARIVRNSTAIHTYAVATGYTNSAVDAIIATLDAPMSDSLLAAKYIQIERLTNADAITTGVFIHPGVVAVNKDLKNVKPGPLSPQMVWNYWEWTY